MAVVHCASSRLGSPENNCQAYSIGTRKSASQFVVGFRYVELKKSYKLNVRKKNSKSEKKVFNVVSNWSKTTCFFTLSKIINFLLIFSILLQARKEKQPPRVHKTTRLQLRLERRFAVAQERQHQIDREIITFYFLSSFFNVIIQVQEEARY